MSSAAHPATATAVAPKFQKFWATHISAAAGLLLSSECQHDASWQYAWHVHIVKTSRAHSCEAKEQADPPNASKANEY